MFGGVARLDSLGRTPAAELKIALAGPGVSLGFAVVSLVVATLSDRAGGDALLVASLEWLGIINISVVVFNLMPAAPLDGGRVLSAVLWRRWADERRAHVAAARTGRIFGSTLVGFGMLSLLTLGAAGGLWLMLIGWFLIGAADAEINSWALKSSLDRLSVADVMTPHPIAAPSAMKVDDFFDDVVAVSRHAAYPVVDQRGGLVGLLPLRSLRGTPRNRWSSLRVIDLTQPLTEVPVATSSTRLVDMLARTHAGTESRTLVVDNGQLVGIIAPSDIARLIEVVGIGEPVGPPR